MSVTLADQLPSAAPETQTWFGAQQRRLAIATGAFLALAVVLRLVRYVLAFPLWDDESFLCANLIDRGFWELLAPLDFHQVAPPLYLWMQLAVVKLAGYSEWSLRLTALLASLGSIGLFYLLTRRLLDPVERLVAVAAFAVSYSGVRYAAEAKQYAGDTLVALGLLCLAVEFMRTRQSRWLWGLVLLAPVAIGVSYPATFVAGGVSLLLLPMLRGAGYRAVVAWLLYNLSVAGSFGAVFMLAAAAQSSAELGFMGDYWRNTFPPAQPLAFARWLIDIHTGGMLAIPVGGERGASLLTTLAVVGGLFAAYRQRRWLLLGVCLLPLALNFVAAALQRYPYGGHVKFSQYLAPAICLLMGVGIAALAARWHQRPQRALQVLRVALAALLLIGVGILTRDCLHPYKTLTDARARDFARWFWFNVAFDNEVVCLKSDLGVEFSRHAWHELNWTAMYLCNQRIYSPRHAQGRPPAWDQVSRERPLRCVEYRVERGDFDAAAHQRWMQAMLASYELVGEDRYAVPCYDKRERTLINVDYLHVYNFVPRAEGTPPQLPVDLVTKPVWRQ